MADDSIQMNTASAMSSAVSDLSVANPNDDQFTDAKDELVSRFTLLPDDVKAAIMDTGYQQKLFDLAKTQKLTYEELGVLETETTMVLLGMTKPEDYRDELQKEIKKNDTEVNEIVKAVNEQVFTPIRASLERIYAVPKEPDAYIPDSIVSGEPDDDLSAEDLSFVDKIKASMPAPTPGVTPLPASVPLSVAIPISRPAASTSIPAAVPLSTQASSTPAPMSASASGFIPTPAAVSAPAAPVSPTPTPTPVSSFSTSTPRVAMGETRSVPTSLTSLEKNVLGTAGIVIDTPIAPAPSAPASQIPDRANLLASIENPSRIAPNLIADKLKAAGATFTATKTTDYSMPAKTGAPAAPTTPGTQAPAATPAKPYVDPYREPI